MAIDITNKNEKQIALTGAQIEETLLQAHLSKAAIAKINGLQSSAGNIDNMVVNGATQADLDALALSTGNLTELQVATIDNLSGLTSNASAIDDSVLITSSTIEEDNTNDIYTFVDSENKVLMTLKKDGFLYDSENNKIGSSNTGSSLVSYANNIYPYSNGSTVSILSMEDEGSIQFEITIVGYPDKTTGIRRTSIIQNNSITHPKVLFIPNGWNGYSYWMGVTPYFGSSYGSESENPHILCSNDGINWIQLLSLPIDLPYGSPAYFSDTHILLGDDNYLYCYYRGTSMLEVEGEPTGSRIYYKKSNDGITWSDRTYLVSCFDSVCPVIINSEKNGFHYFDVLSATGEIRKRWSISNTVIPNASEGYSINIINEPWIIKETGYKVWHIDIDKIGNLWLGLIEAQTFTSGFTKDVYLMWSGDGYNWNVIEEKIGGDESYYRSCIVPISYINSQATIDIYLSKTNGGIINKIRTILEIN